MIKRKSSVTNKKVAALCFLLFLMSLFFVSQFLLEGRSSLLSAKETREIELGMIFSDVEERVGGEPVFFFPSDVEASPKIFSIHLFEKFDSSGTVVFDVDRGRLSYVFEGGVLISGSSSGSHDGLVAEFEFEVVEVS